MGIGVGLLANVNRAVELVHKSSDSDSSIFKTPTDCDSFIKAQYVLTF
jgi:hypothetical protein